MDTKTTTRTTNGAHKNGYMNGASSSIIPWLAVVMSVGSAFLTVANPRDDVKQARQEMREDARGVEARLMGEIAGFKHSLGDRLLIVEHNEFARRISESLATTKNDITIMRADMVPRTEHQQHWMEIGERIAAVRDGVNDLRKDFVSIAPPADRMKGMEAQITALQARLDAIVRMSGAPQAQVQIAPPAAR